MAYSVQKPEDWVPYEAEIRSLYLDQNWTLGKTMKHMELKYGFKATVRQYKRRFNKKKNLTTAEWIIIGKLIEKRSRKGKRTDVRLCQRQVDPKKIVRELARRKSQIDRAKTPVQEDDHVHGRTSFRTPPPSPGMNGQTALSAEDDGDDVPWGTYIALSPAESICSVSHIIPSDGSDRDMEHVTSRLSTPYAVSEIDFNDLNRLDIEFLTFNLPIARLQNYLREQRDTLSSVTVHPLTSGHTVPSSISHSWSEDSLTGLLNEAFPEIFDIMLPIGASNRKAHNALEIALFTITNDLFSHGPYCKNLNSRIQIFKWFTEPAHLALMDSLRKKHTRHFSDFAHSFLRLSFKFFYFFDRGESQNRLIDIIHTLVTSRLPSNFFISSETHYLLSEVAGFDCLNLVQLMVDSGTPADNNSCEVGWSWNPIFSAAKNRRLDILQYLVNQSVDINSEEPGEHYKNTPLTALGYALERDAMFWDADCSEEGPTSLTLLSYGADINARAFSCGATALEWAAFNAPQVYDRFIQHDPTIEAAIPVVFLIGRAAHGGPREIISTIQKHICSSLDLEGALIFAVYYENIQVTRTLLQANINPNCARYSNITFKHLFEKSKIFLQGNMKYEDLLKPLRTALYNWTDELVELLLDFGAEITAREIDILWQRFGLEYSVMQLSTGVLWRIFDSCKGKFSGDLLLFATYSGDRELLKVLLETIKSEDSSWLIPRQLHSRSPDRDHFRSRLGCVVWSPLQVALARGDATLARWLWDYGFRFHPHPDDLYSTGWYELGLACNFLRTDSVMHQLIDVFLEHGAIPDSPLADYSIKWRECLYISPVSIDTCLHSILRGSQSGLLPEVFSLSKKFIEYGVDLARIGIIGNEYIPASRPFAWLTITLVGTAVQTACFYGLADVARLLVDSGANIHAAASPDQGRTALQAACGSMTPSLDLIQYLLDQRCDVNSPPADNYGVTALQAAAARGYIHIAIRLLSAGADVNAPAGKIYGKTAIEAAAEYGRLDMVKLLINAGARGDIEVENKFHGAIRLAEMHGHQHVADLLREHE